MERKSERKKEIKERNFESKQRKTKPTEKKKKRRSPSEREFSLVGKKGKTNPFFSHYDRWLI